jgi:hypothetical protein
VPTLKLPTPLLDRLPALLILAAPAFATGGLSAAERWLGDPIDPATQAAIKSLSGAAAVAGSAIGGMLIRSPLDAKLVYALAAAVFGAATYHQLAEVVLWIVWKH